MLSLITPSFTDLLLGLLIGFGAVVLLIAASQLLRQRSTHSIYSLGICFIVGIFVAVQAGLWFKADELIEEAERKAMMLNGVREMVDNTVPTDSISHWMGNEVGEVVSAGKEGSSAAAISLYEQALMPAYNRTVGNGGKIILG